MRWYWNAQVMKSEGELTIVDQIHNTCVSVCRWRVRSSVHVHICFVSIHRVSLLDNLLLVDRLKASITTPMKASITTPMIRHLSLWRATTLCDASHFPPSGNGIATLVPAIKIYLASRYLKCSACSCSTATLFGQFLLHSVGTMHVVVSRIPKQVFFFK